MKSIGKQVKEAREQLGLTQERLARMTFTNVFIIDCIEGGKMFPTPYLKVSLSFALKIPIVELASYSFSKNVLCASFMEVCCQGSPSCRNCNGR